MPQYALAIVLGSLLALYGNQLPDQSWSAFVPITLLLCWLIPAYRLVLLLMAAYLWSSAVFHYHLDHRLVEDYDGRVTRMRGIVADIPQVFPGRVRLQLRSLEIPEYPAAMPRLAVLNWYQDELVPGLGESWQFEVKLKQPRGLLNPDSIDYEAWQFTRGIDANGYIRDSTYNRRLAYASALTPDFWRARLSATIDHACADCAFRGVIKALALGYRGEISTSQRRLFKASGTAHLLAISGLHIGMVAAFFYGLGRYCWRIGFYHSGLNRMQTASLFATFAALSYAALAGFSLPTVRALIMFSVFFFALQYRNRINLLQSIALAVVIILVVDPRAAGATSFWLSFGALLVIAFFQSRLPGQMRWWKQLVFVQFYFSVLFAPLGLLIFDQLNPAGLLANMVAIPVVSFAILPIILCGCLVALAGSGTTLGLFQIADRLLDYLFKYLALLVDSGFSSLAIAYPAPLVLMVLVSSILILLPGVRGSTKLGLIMIFIIASWHPARLEHGDFEVVVLDVGMGTSVLLRTRNHSLVYDLGPGIDGAHNAADWALRPILRHHGFDQPDLMIISHVDQDHSGGLYSYIDDYRPSALLSGTPRELRTKFELPHEVRSCHKFTSWRWDGVGFEFLDADHGSGTKGSTNNRSCILMIEGNHRLLIPGDIEASQESKLLAKFGADLETDILLAPHHGSSTSSSIPLLSQLKPKYVVFTVARNNRWGFPTAQVVSRYDALPSRQYRSDRDGAISMTSSAAGLLIRTMRNPIRRIWRRW